MTDGIIVEAIRSVKLDAQTPGTPAPGGPASVADAEAVARFEAAMNVDGADAVQAPSPAGEVPFADKMSALWRSSQENHQGLLHRIRALSEMNGRDGIGMAELTELQYNVATLSFQQEIVAKVADKASNAIQTLIKNQ